MITIQIYNPKALSPLIQCFWYLKVTESTDLPYVEEIFPDGHHEIIFHANSSAGRKRGNSQNWTTDPSAFFAGQNKKSYRQRLRPGAIIYAVRFHPHTQALFYDFPASLSTDNPLPLTDAFPGDSLSNCISKSPSETFANFEKELLKKACGLRRYNSSFQYVDAAVRSINMKKGNVKIQSLEKITGVCTRQLEKVFQRYVGVSPKQFCNITRYGHFIAYKRNHPDKTLTQCAHELEFHDQSHLIHLSRLITGRSPKSCLSQPTCINDFFLKS